MALQSSARHYHAAVNMLLTATVRETVRRRTARRQRGCGAPTGFRLGRSPCSIGNVVQIKATWTDPFSNPSNAAARGKITLNPLKAKLRSVQDERSDGPTSPKTTSEGTAG